MHISHIVTAPLIGSVTVLPLSLVTLQFAILCWIEVTIDLPDPCLLVAFSFIIDTISQGL
jgi:hypothetical protein